MAVTAIWAIKGRVDSVLRYASDPDKTEHKAYLASLHAIRDVVDRMVDEFARKTTEEWRGILQKADIPFAVLAQQREAGSNPQALLNGNLQPYAYPDGNTPSIPQPPMGFSEYARRPFAPAGAIGENTGELLAGLGYSPEEIASLREKGSIL